MFSNFQRFWAIFVACYILSSLSLALITGSSKWQIRPFASRTLQHQASNARLYMAEPNKETGDQENPLSKFMSRFSKPTSEPDIEPIELDDEIENALWFDPTPFVKNISLPNIFFGSVLGAIVAIGTIFAPFFLPEDFSFPAGQLYSNRNELSNTCVCEIATLLVISIEE
jgi:hypothetical protein